MADALVVELPKLGVVGQALFEPLVLDDGIPCLSRPVDALRCRRSSAADHGTDRGAITPSGLGGGTGSTVIKTCPVETHSFMNSISEFSRQPAAGSNVRMRFVSGWMPTTTSK